MRVGTLCYATRRGLGYLAKNFIDSGVIQDICIVEHTSVPRQVDWYPGAPVVPIGRADNPTTREYIRRHDAMLFFETPFAWTLVPFCRSVGVKTFLVTMYECTPERLPENPDVLLCPSGLDMQEFPSGTRVHIPVEVPWRRRCTAKTFVHNGGYLGLKGREGTTTLIEAMQHVRSDLRLIVRVQENVDARHLAMARADSRITYIPESVPFDDLYSSGDVYVAPQKFNGMSMPLLEACASGMPVMTTDRFPANTWLPKEILIPVERTERVRLAGRFRPIDLSHVNPVALAAHMDSWFDKDIHHLSDSGLEWRNANTWEALKPRWLELFA